MWSWFLIGVLAVSVLAWVHLMWRLHGRSGYVGPGDTVINYEGAQEDGYLRLRCTLGDGRRVSMRVDKATVYQMSNDMLIAAGALGAKHPNDARTEISDPELLAELKRRAL